MTRPRNHVEVLSLVIHNSTLKKNMDTHAMLDFSIASHLTVMVIQERIHTFSQKKFLMAKKNVNARFQFLSTSWLDLILGNFITIRGYFNRYNWFMLEIFYSNQCWIALTMPIQTTALILKTASFPRAVVKAALKGGSRGEQIGSSAVFPVYKQGKIIAPGIHYSISMSTIKTHFKWHLTSS